MDYQSLLYFTAIAEHKNITKAADSLFISQQALSKAVSRMEDELGVTLLRRSRSGVELTEYGQMFLSYAMSTSKLHDSLRERFGRLKSSRGHDTVYFGYDTGLVVQFSPGFLESFISSHPDTEFHTSSFHADYYNRLTVHDEVNLLLTSTPPLTQAFEQYCKISFGLRILLGKNNPLAKKEILTWDDIRQIPVININIENEFSRSLNLLFKLNDIKPQHVIDPNELVLLQYLCEECGAATIFSGNSKVLPEWGALVPFESGGVTMDVYICTRSGAKLSKSELELAELMRKELTEMSN